MATLLKLKDAKRIFGICPWCRQKTAYVRRCRVDRVGIVYQCLECIGKQLYFEVGPGIWQATTA